MLCVLVRGQLWKPAVQPEESVWWWAGPGWGNYPWSLRIFCWEKLWKAPILVVKAFLINSDITYGGGICCRCSVRLMWCGEYGWIILQSCLLIKFEYFLLTSMFFQFRWQVGRVLRQSPSWCRSIWAGRFCWMSLWLTDWL